MAEITDDTGGKCTIETAARKLNRKVSGSFKAIIGSAVKFGLITSKRELLTTTTLFKRIKHAYDKQEELTFHREAFLTPPLFTQICRKFRLRELPVQMLDVMLIREFGVEEINAQGVAKAFVDGCRMVGLLDEHNTVADIDSFSAQQMARQQLASPIPRINAFRAEPELTPNTVHSNLLDSTTQEHTEDNPSTETTTPEHLTRNTPNLLIDKQPRSKANVGDVTNNNADAIASLFGFVTNPTPESPTKEEQQLTTQPNTGLNPVRNDAKFKPDAQPFTAILPPPSLDAKATYQIQISGPGVNTELSINEEEDIILAIALLEKIRRQIKN